MSDGADGGPGYGRVTKALHWLTVAALTAQFVVGWSMDLDDGGHGRGRGGGSGRGRGGDDDDAAATALSDVVRGDAFDDGLSLPEVHIGLGLLVAVLGLVRIAWRRATPLPPWAGYLGPAERRLEGGLEKLLLALLLVVPATGLLLVAAGDDDWLPLHVTAQIALLAAVTAHVGLVLKHTVVRRHRHLARML